MDIETFRSKQTAFSVDRFSITNVNGQVHINPEPNDKDEYYKIINHLYLINVRQMEQIVILKLEYGTLNDKYIKALEENASLKATISELQILVSQLQNQVGQLQTQMNDISTTLTSLINESNKITIRGIMRALEKQICFKIAGSKTNARRYYNFDLCSRDAQMKAALDANVSTDLQGFIGRLKDEGDFVIHDNRPSTSLSELENYLVEEDENDVKKLIALVKSHLYDSSSDSLNLSKPF